MVNGEVLCRGEEIPPYAERKSQRPRRVRQALLG